MVRPRKPRIVESEPDVTYFKPRAVPLRLLGEENLTVDELEALRLSDMLGLSQAEAAKKMQVHQSTFHRNLSGARKKVARALACGRAIRIRGGDYKMQTDIQVRQRRGRMGGPLTAGPGGVCVCAGCGHETAHIRGRPCSMMKCPKCGSPMARR